MGSEIAHAVEIFCHVVPLAPHFILLALATSWFLDRSTGPSPFFRCFPRVLRIHTQEKQVMRVLCKPCSVYISSLPLDDDSSVKSSNDMHAPKIK
jgi:hypothetical protein